MFRGIVACALVLGGAQTAGAQLSAHSGSTTGSFSSGSNNADGFCGFSRATLTANGTTFIAPVRVAASAIRSQAALCPDTATLRGQRKLAHCGISPSRRTSSGDYFAIGVGGAVTGKGADLLIIDDPHTEQEAALAEVNPEIYDKVYEWYT